MPEVCDSTVRREQPKAGLITGVKSQQASRIGRCGWITSFLRKSSREFFTVELSIDNRIFPVAMRFWETPVHIPNTMVKTEAADNTILVTVWEGRWLPDL